MNLPSVRQVASRVRAIGTALYALTVHSAYSLWTTIHEPFTGAWQQNATEDTKPTILKWPAVFHVVTGIASDIAKLRVKLSREDADGIWEEIKDPRTPFLAVLKKPNHYQTRLKFFESWVISLLLYGNAYILKERDNRGIVVRMYVLDPCYVVPQLSQDGEVFYRLSLDLLAGVSEEYLRDQEIAGSVPASEIIHDRMVCLFHPLVGVSPLFAAAMAATMGRKIQDDATVFFGNSAMPGGVITGPQRISNDAALRIKTAFETNFGGANRGRIAVMGENLKFEPMRLNAEQSQVEEQYNLAIEDVARAFRYPLWKLTGKFPPYSSSPEMLTVTYYTDCLQPLIESIEACLDEGLALPDDYGTEFDLENLMRMDTASQIKMLAEGVKASLFAPNEARKKLNYKPVEGGESPMAQQQDYSLAALAKRDAKEDPFGSKSNAAAAPASDTPPSTEDRSAANDEELQIMADSFELNLRRFIAV